MKKYFSHKNQKGQAVFEFIIFIPFLVFLYTIFYTVGNSISGSINEQKSVRGYYYNLVKGNSYLLTANDLAILKQNSMKRMGFMAIGFREKTKNDTQQFAPCFQFSSMLKGQSKEECDDGNRQEEGSSSFVRIFTAYGVCGPMYSTTPEGNLNIEYTAQSRFGVCVTSIN